MVLLSNDERNDLLHTLPNDLRIGIKHIERAISVEKDRANTFCNEGEITLHCLDNFRKVLNDTLERYMVK